MLSESVIKRIDFYGKKQLITTTIITGITRIENLVKVKIVKEKSIFS